MMYLGKFLFYLKYPFFPAFKEKVLLLENDEVKLNFKIVEERGRAGVGTRVESVG